jgi:flagellar secretion chaperone FliS
MKQDAPNEYLRNAVMTAAPEQLQMMLYDGAIRFVRQAREAMEKCDLETSCEKLLRAQRIVVEMQNGLRPEISPELCAQMSSLYGFVYGRLVESNMKRDVSMLDQALQVLEHMRETWRLLLDKLRTTHPSNPSTSVSPAAVTAGVGETLSVEC